MLISTRFKLLIFFNFLFIVFNFAQGQLMQTSCGQTVIAVNGKYYLTCPGGYLDEYNRCIPYKIPQCPSNYVYHNGLCYLPNHVPLVNCPLSNNQCNQVVNPPCLPIPQTQPPVLPPPVITYPPYVPPVPTTPPPPPPPPPTLPPLPPPAQIIESRCPPESIFTNGRCRKIICSQGEYYEGKCLQPACPEGKVWRGRRCQEPAYVRTVIEIENVFKNEAHHKPWKIHVFNKTNVEYHTNNIEITTDMPIWSSTTRKPRTTVKPGTDCCTIVTPRICKNYGKKWVCFNRRYQRCDRNICKSPTVYLKTPKIAYNPPILIMPPNPPLQACETPNCDNANTIDCSGCPNNRRDTCSPYCYRYMCPHDSCNYMELKDYCTKYPGEMGCARHDGCLWDWCG